jgi:LacI family transcriptional regulator
MTNPRSAKGRRVTMTDVAKLAGVSQTTVSFVVNSIEAGLPERTKLKVLEACGRLNYTPNEAARRLASRVSKAIGLAIYDVTAIANYRQSAAVVIAAVYRASEARQHRLQIYTTHERKDDGADIGTYFAVPVRSREVDGIVVWDQFVDEKRVTMAFDEGLPIVTLDRCVGNVPAVVPDYEQGFRDIAALVARKGYDRVCVAVQAGNYYRDSRSMGAFLSAAAGHGIPAESVAIVEVDIETQTGPALVPEIADRILASKPKALVCMYDTIALGAIALFRERGLRIPEDIAVVGCAGVPASGDPEYDLTTLDIRHDLMGRHAVDMVLRMVKGENLAGSCTVVQPELIIRSSA